MNDTRHELTPVVDFGRETCGEWDIAKTREWMVTNGLGGYAMGTISGAPTRRYHGLLIASLHPPVARTLMLSKLDETVEYEGREYELFCNRLADRSVSPQGFRFLERFHLEGAVPVWTFACAGALLEKRVWMEHGAQTTYIRYSLSRASGPLRLRLAARVSGRDHHGNLRATDGIVPRVNAIPRGLTIGFSGGVSMSLRSDRAEAAPADGSWLALFLGVEQHRGLDPLDEVFTAGHFEVVLPPGESVTFAASLEDGPDLDGAAALARCRAREEDLLRRGAEDGDPGWVRQLLLAADQFVVRRSVAGDAEGRTIIAGYPWFEDWGRDTMIALPGLTLAAGRPEIARRLLLTFAQFVDQGMLPNRFTEWGERPDYNTVDATLWYFDAIRAYHEATGDDALLKELFPVLRDIVDWHRRGTRYGIRMDPADGLIQAGEPGVQLTWMDAKVGDWVVTPRIGKPVEINALWYNALCVMEHFARKLEEPSAPYADLASRSLKGFGRFWNEQTGGCFDVLDGPGGDDPAVRPNQVIAAALPHSPLTPMQRRSVVALCARELLASHGLRSLAPGEPAYIGRFGGDQRKRDAAYHQGTVWAWLIGPFVSAHLRAHGDPKAAASFLDPFARHLAAHGLGSVSEIFEGDPPFAPRGCIAQAWSVAEILRAWREIQRFQPPA